MTNATHCTRYELVLFFKLSFDDNLGETSEAVLQDRDINVVYGKAIFKL